MCKHIIGALIAASRLDARTVPLPALPPEGSAPGPAGGTGVATEALRALRDVEEGAARGSERWGQELGGQNRHFPDTRKREKGRRKKEQHNVLSGTQLCCLGESGWAYGCVWVLRELIQHIWVRAIGKHG